MGRVSSSTGASRLAQGGGAAAALTALGLLAFGFTEQREGLRLAAYQDVIGVWTACQGVTEGVREGMVFSRDECRTLFIDELIEHEAGMRGCLAAPDSIPGETYVAFVSFTYNVGVGAFCASTLARLANAGDLRGACAQLPRWVYAGGRRVKGLVSRRADEHELCLSGLATVTDNQVPDLEEAT